MLPMPRHVDLAPRVRNDDPAARAADRCNAFRIASSAEGVNAEHVDAHLWVALT